MRRAHFRVVARADGPRMGPVTVTISQVGEQPDALISVRPLRRKRTFDMPLAHVAQLVVERVIRAEVALKKAERRASRKRRVRS